MKRKDRDELLRYGFGELDEAELKRLEARIASDPELAREANTVGQMREALSGLRQVPECQLSIERVRDAILRDEMGARRASIWRWGATLAPIAATCLAIAVFARLQHQGTMDQIASGLPQSTDVVATSMSATVDTGPYTIADPTESMIGEPLRAVETPPVKRVRTRSQSSPAVSERSAAPTASRGADVSAARGGVRPAMSNDAATNDSVSEAMDSAPAEVAPTVVIIDPEESTHTGARMASEVETSQHVLIGG